MVLGVSPPLKKEYNRISIRLGDRIKRSKELLCPIALFYPFVRKANQSALALLPKALLQLGEMLLLW